MGERTDSLVNVGASPLCDTVRSKIGHMDELEGNYRFCSMPEVEKILFKHEKAFASSSHSHQKLCRTWLDAKSIEIQQRFGSASSHGNEKGRKEEHIEEEGHEEVNKKEHIEEDGQEEVRKKKHLEEEEGHKEVRERNQEEENKHRE
jgi:hypothetical protein